MHTTTTYSRRRFLQFLGRTGAVATGLSMGLPLLNSCSKPPTTTQGRPLPFQAILPTNTDDLVLAKGFDYQVLIKWQDRLTPFDTFGFNNDYLAFEPFNVEQPNDGLLWVNHEATDPQFVSFYKKGTPKTQAQVELEQYSVGGSIVRVRRSEQGEWEFVPNDPLNRRLTAATPIPFAWHEPIEGKMEGIGTLGNCAGGITPYGTILTCEENYDLFYGETDYKNNRQHINSYYGWETYFNYPPEHYGWVVEVELKTGKAQKLVALGRCAHECATVATLPDGRLVVYTGDDANDQCLYKFISTRPNDLTEGKLYVANLEQGKWISLDYETQSVLQRTFKSQTEVLIRLREAAALVGGTALDRPEDIAIDPQSGNIFVTLTNNVPKDNYFGSILKITERNNDKRSLKFDSPKPSSPAAKKWALPAPTTSLSTPRVTSGLSPIYRAAPCTNRLTNRSKTTVCLSFPSTGPNAGEVIQVGSAPTDAELTGPYFSPDGTTLFFSVQHPGETSPSLKRTHQPLARRQQIRSPNRRSSPLPALHSNFLAARSKLLLA